VRKTDIMKDVNLHTVVNASEKKKEADVRVDLIPNNLSKYERRFKKSEIILNEFCRRLNLR
jgi:hypothetical protein